MNWRSLGGVLYLGFDWNGRLRSGFDEFPFLISVLLLVGVLEGEFLSDAFWYWFRAMLNA